MDIFYKNLRLKTFNGIEKTFSADYYQFLLFRVGFKMIYITEKTFYVYIDTTYKSNVFFKKCPHKTLLK